MTIDSRNIAWAALAAAIVSVVFAGIAIVGARTNWWTAEQARFLVGIATGVACAVAVAALAAIAIAIRGGRGGIVAAVATLAIAGGMIGFGFAHRAAEARWPPIHDVTTDITNPVRFQTLSVTGNNLQPVPDRGRHDLAGLTSDVRWRTWHVERYADIRPIAVPMSVARTMARVRAIATARGWRIAAYEPAGRLEATATSGLFADKDDIAIVARPATETRGSIVSMRSVGRGEGGDAGRNAARIKSVLSELKNAR